MKEKCMITGATGFLANSLISLLEKDFELIKVGHTALVDDVEQADLGDPNHCRRLVSDYKPDIIIHTAFHRDSDFCESRPGTSKWLNVESTHMLAGALMPTAKFVYISSAQVFDGENSPYREGDATSPLNVYGQHKTQAEDFALMRPNTLVVRLGELIGRERDEGVGFLSGLQQAIDGPPGELDDVHCMYPTCVEEAALAIRHLLTADASGIYHAAAGEGGTRYALNRTFAAVTNQDFEHIKANPETRIQSGKAKLPRNPELNIEKLQAAGFSGFTPFSQLLEKFIERSLIAVSDEQVLTF